MSLLSLALSSVLGWYLVGSWLGAESPGRWARAALGVGAGMGLTVLISFVSLFVGIRDWKWLCAAQCLLVMGFIAFGAASPPVSRRSIGGRVPRRIVLLLGVAAVLALLHIRTSPFGSGLDAWAIWKLKARFLFEAPEQWRLIFSNELGFSHPDYPLFYPLAIVSGWAWEESVLAVWGVCAFFSVSTAMLLAASLAEDRRAWPIGAAALLLATPHFNGMGASQYADSLIAYFFLAAGSLSSRALTYSFARTAVLAGALAGCGAFTKNEGVLGLAVACALFVPRPKLLFFFLVGALPWIAALAALKFEAGSFSEFFRSAAMHVSDPASRSRLIAGHTLTAMLRESYWGWAWVFLCGTAMFRWRGFLGPGARECAVFVLLIVAGYFTVYMITPHDLAWQLSNSADRLLLQLYPLCIYAVFSATRPARL